MLVPLLVLYVFHEQLIFGPIYVIFLAVSLILMLRFPASKPKVGAFLVLVGIVEVFFGGPVQFFWGIPIALITIIVGLVGRRGHASSSLPQIKHTKSKKLAYAVLATVILVSCLVFSLRITNVLHEQSLETFHDETAKSDSPRSSGQY